MTMTRQPMNSQFGQDVSVSIEALSPDQLRYITLAGGQEVQVQNAEIVQFAIGEAHSPVTPSKLYPALRYVNAQGRVQWTPLKAIVAFSDGTKA